MLARRLLPSFGGSPAVWNTCLVCFQVLLLAGYAYAHGALRFLGVRRQAMLHAALLVVSLFVLRHAISAGTVVTPWPEGSVLLTLLGTAGVPFFLLSTNSSLTQRWFATGEFRTSHDPFWLYAASNAGSLVALLAYPLLVERALGVNAQFELFAAGYVVFVLLTLAIIVLTIRRNASSVDEDVASPVAGETPQRLRWVIRSAVASSLLLSISMQITTEVIAAPLFWVVPLALYLVTFIVAFSRGHRPARERIAFATTIGIALCLLLVVLPTVFPLWFALVTLLGTLFVGALLCHGDLADERPHASDLTSFYLWISVGGAIGGVLNGIIAPVVFSSVAEYPITLFCLACLIGKPTRSWRELASLPVLAMIIATVVAAMFVVVSHRHVAVTLSDATPFRWQFMPVLVLLCGVLLSRRPAVFPAAIGLVATFLIAGFHFVDPIIDQGRSFFGVSRVTENATERILIHGVTVHGGQRKAPALRDIPISYYYADGPLGWAVTSAPESAEIGVVGLGAGSLATLTRAGQRLTFFEIDPLVEAMARRDFTYLADAKATVAVQIGDGRQLLAQTPDGTFDRLILDAFSSDAIPTHLLTEEALAMYLRKLKPSGLLVVHVSNRYADLSRVFRGWHEATGQRVAMTQYVPSAALEAQGVHSTVAIALAASPHGLAPLAQTKQWYWIESDGPSVHWTDDYVSIMGVLDRNILKP